ncbi:tryptophan synthase beta subunit-like PLP-dependent enzyme [Ascodesmis nigricans]|uniref:threonine synthase n=1 Tax=Ascodesmis nigricans TaxID=341454 RepID=A0A4S2N3U9_9PEZI|nr:tryptophan synthase beta subunit-like PLP-dependent enzyme [Ascodesmis nigricans]
MASPTASQRYLSTRGGSYGFTFEEAVLKGLASDNGLFIPESIPELPADWQSRWANLSFQDLAFEILSLYISPSEIPASDLRDLITRSYSTFRDPKITPVRPLAPEQDLHVLELFHGPTFAFKDVALQMVGNLFEYFLIRKNARIGETVDGKRHALTVIGATSGDTGSAAIYGLRGKKDVSVFILHPLGRVSPIQEAQMTTVLDSNVHNLAVKGTFDDCQDIVKTLFAHPEMNRTHNLGAVNSINWARILSQIVYYFSAFFQLGGKSDLQFVVPTGNFGDVLAGYFAKRMGMPMRKLVIATNENDILDRFCRSGRYAKNRGAEVAATLSPAMDILVSSNFERLLWYLALENALGGKVPMPGEEPINEAKKQAGETVNRWMNDLKTTGGTEVPQPVLDAMRRDFDSERVDDETTIQTIKEIFQSRSYVLDPHTAVGVASALRKTNEKGTLVALSTAHPAKFNEAVERALGGLEGYDFEANVRPEEFQGLEQREKRVRVVERPDAELVKTVVEEMLQSEGKV